MKRKIVHLADDFSLGGVTRSLDAITKGFGRDLGDHQIVGVRPKSEAAPTFDADVIITHFPPSWQSLAYLWQLRRTNRSARLVHVEHSYTACWERIAVPSPRRFRTMLRLAWHLSDRVVAVSQGQAGWMRRIAPEIGCKLSVALPWSGRQALDALEPRSRTERLVIGAYGRFDRQKGFDVLIEAASQIDPARYEIVIGGFGSDEAAFHAAAASLPHVRFFGKVTSVADFMSQCDVIAVPSRWEAFGQVAMEAKLAARPILVSHVDGLIEQVGLAGLSFEPDNAADLCRAIEIIATMDLAAMGKSGRESLIGAEGQRLAAWQEIIAPDYQGALAA